MQIKYCPNCGEKKEAGDRYCSRCGCDLTNINKRQMNYCPNCGKEKKINARFCNQCGFDFSIFESRSTSNSTSNSTPKPVQVPHPSLGNVEVSAASILKIVAVISAVLFTYWALRSIVYFNYSSVQAKVWAFLSVTTGISNAILTLLIAFRCRKEYGRSLFYTLSGNEIIRVCLKLYYIQDKARYYDIGLTDYLPIFGAAILIVAFNFLMKQQDMLCTTQEESFGDSIRKIPYAIRKAFNPNFVGNESQTTGKTIFTRKKTDNARRMAGYTYTNNQEQALMWIPKGKVYLVFTIFFTANLVISIFSHFSFVSLIFKIIPIIMCVGFWKIYCNQAEYERGTNLISITLMVRFCLHIIFCVVMLIVIFSLGLGIWSYLIAIALVCMDLAYWYSLRETFSRLTNLGRGENVEVTAGLYPVFVLILGIIVKVLSFLWALWLQSVANGLNSKIYGYGADVSSEVANILSLIGLDYRWVYGEASGYIGAILRPITEWIQDTLGFSQNPILMIIVIVIPVCEVMLLNSIRYTRRTTY